MQTRGIFSLAAVAASPAIVKSGKGRTDISGARRALLASTSGGDLCVKAVPHDYYQLSSRSGTIASNFVRPRLSLWTRAQSWDTSPCGRDDVAKPDTGVRHSP